MSEDNICAVLVVMLETCHSPQYDPRAMQFSQLDRIDSGTTLGLGQSQVSENSRCAVLVVMSETCHSQQYSSRAMPSSDYTDIYCICYSYVYCFIMSGVCYSLN